jgi:hypothetical protein
MRRIARAWWQTGAKDSATIVANLGALRAKGNVAPVNEVADMYDRFGLFTDRCFTSAMNRRTALVFSPVPEQSLVQVPVASQADTEAAIAVAGTGFAARKAKSAFESADALHAIADQMKRRSDEAAAMISLETGKQIAQAVREWGLSIGQVRCLAERARCIWGRSVESRVPGARFEAPHYDGTARRKGRSDLAGDQGCREIPCRESGVKAIHEYPDVKPSQMVSA